jgi:CheY-like chemotaxis protein/two-component sensor histidine kinase
MGFASLLSDELTDPYLKEMANIILQSTKRLTETVNSILDLSKIEAERLNLKISRVDLVEVVKNIADQFNQTAKEKNIFLDIVVRNDNNIAELDKSLAIQVIKNLIHNAIKFTSKGGVAVEIEKVNINSKSLVEVRVVDTGIGIDQKNFTKIFEPFRQVSEGLSRGFEGSGLGLTITKKYVELLHGEIFVESNVKLGSKFTVRFPTVVESKLRRENNIKSENQLSISNGSNGNASPNLLIVEDDDLNRSTIEHYLKDSYNFESVSSGESAVKVVKRKKYDIILMDIALKGMSGLEAAQLIKKVPGNENVPIVAVTAYAMIGDKEKLLKGGCTHYLAKPFTQTSLLSLIKSILK